MSKPLSVLSRIILFVCAVSLIAVLFTPVWRIELDAPQYPEGLVLYIHATGLKGNVDIINGLNHYIGMKSLHNEDFIEFKLLPYFIVFFALANILIIFINRKKWLNILFIAFVCFGIVAMIDFWKWEYDYGHNLNPNAAIVVPNMSYQPPLIGFKQLLNFGAYSVPDIGGWIFIVVGALLGFLVFYENYYRKKLRNKNLITSLIFLFFLSGCTTDADKIVVGKDNCAMCKMTITDPKYGAELVTKKGKVFKFDDVDCMMSFLKDDVNKISIKDKYIVDYCANHSLVNINNAFLLKSVQIHAPMNGNIIGFSSEDSLQKYAQMLKGEKLNRNYFGK